MGDVVVLRPPPGAAERFFGACKSYCLQAETLKAEAAAVEGKRTKRRAQRMRAQARRLHECARASASAGADAEATATGAWLDWPPDPAA